MARRPPRRNRIPAVLIAFELESSAPLVLFDFDRSRPGDRDRLVRWLGRNDAYWDVIKSAIELRREANAKGDDATHEGDDAETSGNEFLGAGSPA